MGEFQLILLKDVPRPARDVPPPRSFSLIPYRTRAEMIAEQRALTADDIAGWLVPGDALPLVVEAYGGENYVARLAIVQRLRGGFLRSAAERSSWKNVPRVSQTGPIRIDPDLWLRVRVDSDFWISGQTVIDDLAEYSGGYDVTARLFGIRFHPDDIREMVAQAPKKIATSVPQPAPSADAPNKGGRPRKEWWDDFWIDICGQIYEGNLKPARQAELEKAMLDWATNHGHEMSEATARKAAKKLFNAWKLGG
jgi:hypothetical protein